MVLAATCGWSPAAIVAMSRLSAAIGRSWRFAGRSLGRSRARSAAVVTAIAVTGAIGVSGSALALNIGHDDDRARLLPLDAVVLEPAVEVAPKVGLPGAVEELSGTPLDDSARRQLERILPEASVYPRRVAAWTPAPESNSMGLSIAIADPAVIDLYELDAAERAALESEGALLMTPWFDEDGPVEHALSIATSDGEIVVPFAMRDRVREAMENRPGDEAISLVYGFDVLMITEAQARRLGFDVVERGAIVRNGSDLTRQQRDALERTFAGEAPLADWYEDADSATVSWWPLMEYGESPPPRAAVLQGLAVAGVLVLTLLVVAIGLSLAATESRDERDVLVAVGARPRTMRSLAGTKAIVMTLTGLGLAIPAGLVPTKAITEAVDDPLRMPWLVIVGLLVAVPMIAGATAWVASSVAQRVRPVRMSNFSFE
jgi:putative ABC transport system permease protein